MHNISFTGTLLMSLLLGSVPSVAQSITSCYALVERSNDLYSIDSNGNPVARFTSDGQPKDVPAISPDGSKVAFITGGALDTVLVASSTGQKQSFVPAPIDEGDADHIVPTTATLLRVYWQSSNVLVAEFHVSPDTSEFNFYSIPQSSSDEVKMLGQNVGTSCALLSGGSNVACAGQGTALVDDKLVYDDAFAGATKVGSATIAMGASASLGNAPTFQVAVQSLNQGITLQITPESGNWTKQSVDPGAYIRLAASGILFDFVPTIADASNGMVKVDLYQSPLDLSAVDAASAIRASDNSFAMIERVSGSANVVVLTPPGSGSASAWTTVGRASLSVSDAIRHLWFVNDSTMGFETEGTFGQFPISIVTGSGTNSVQIGDITPLPRSISYSVNGVSYTETSYGWSCQ